MPHSPDSERAENGLRTPEQQLRLQAELLELAHDAVIVRDPVSSRVTFWNREAQAIYGYRRDEAFGRVTHELLRTVFPGSLKAVDEALVRDGAASHAPGRARDRLGRDPRRGPARRDGYLAYLHPADRDRVAESYARMAQGGPGFVLEYRVVDAAGAKPEFDGSGIGLAVCRRIVDRHGGTISAHGEPRRGARFTVILPRQAPRSEWWQQEERDGERA